MTALLGLLGPLIPYLVGGIGLLAVGGAAYLGIKKSGRAQQQSADQQATIRAVENRNDAASDVAAKSDNAVTDDLRAKWTR